MRWEHFVWLIVFEFHQISIIIRDQTCHFGRIPYFRQRLLSTMSQGMSRETKHLLSQCQVLNNSCVFCEESSSAYIAFALSPTTFLRVMVTDRSICLSSNETISSRSSCSQPRKQYHVHITTSQTKIQSVHDTISILVQMLEALFPSIFCLQCLLYTCYEQPYIVLCVYSIMSFSQCGMYRQYKQRFLWHHSIYYCIQHSLDKYK